MTLALLLAAVLVLVASGAGAAALDRRSPAALAIGTIGCVAGGALGAGASLVALLRGEVASGRMPWAVPLGELHVGIDPLSSFFLVAIFSLSALSAVYGAGYLSGRNPRRGIGVAVASYNLLAAAMAVVVLARDGVLFLFSWETMSIASFLLVRFEGDEGAERASFFYLVASHFGTAFLFLLFLLLASRAGTFDFGPLSAGVIANTPLASACFLLALVGFGTKAGLWPLHLWLPEAHPAAPSHVSALMSGVMIKMGVYGLCRVLTWLGPPPAWWGVLLLTAAAVSALGGILYALGSRDLKRMLAYSSIENVGIIGLGLGLGLLARAEHREGVAFMALAGALLHVWNHGLFKSLLFLAAGSVVHATHRRDLEALGGLLRRLPSTGLAFLAGSLAASALPPLCGFVSEWMIALAAFDGMVTRGPGMAASIVVITLLALVGGLAAACFVRAFGVAFLGEPRSTGAELEPREERLMVVSMSIAAFACLVLGVFPPALLSLVAPAVAVLVPVRAPILVGAALQAVSVVAALGIALLALVVWLRSRILAGREIRTALTWDCGYAAPSPRMQYTASSFAEPVIAPFTVALRPRISGSRPAGIFPASASYEASVDDLAARVAVSAVSGAGALLSRVTLLQLGRIQVYLLYIFVTVIALLVWSVPW